MLPKAIFVGILHQCNAGELLADTSGVYQPRMVSMVHGYNPGELLARAAFMNHDRGRIPLKQHAISKGLV